ncbi:hypothetical protein D3C79_303730 [compost metagenome]
MRVNIAVQIDPLHAGLILIVGQHLFRRNDPGFQNVLLMVNIVQKGVKRLYALANTAIEHRPLAGGYDARYAVERNQALSAVILTINVKGNPHPVKQQCSLFPLALNGLLVSLLQPMPVSLVVTPVLTLSQKHLIKKR